MTQDEDLIKRHDIRIEDAEIWAHEHRATVPPDSTLTWARDVEAKLSGADKAVSRRNMMAPMVTTPAAEPTPLDELLTLVAEPHAQGDAPPEGAPTFDPLNSLDLASLVGVGTGGNEGCSDATVI